MIFRVSEAESFRQWRDAEDGDVNVLLARLRGEEAPSEAMQAGTAFHRALELSSYGEVAVLEASGYRFQIECEINLALPEIREIRSCKAYGPITLTGCVDALYANRIEDHKTTAHFDAERYLDGYQWRYYLDIFEADSLRWNVFELLQLSDGVYAVTSAHTLEQYRYPALHSDCARLAEELHAFAVRHLPERISQIEQRAA